MNWTWWRWLRLWLVLILGLTLFVLAALQAAGPQQDPGRAVAIGVATKAVTGVIAIMQVRLMQDVMDQLEAALRRTGQPEEQAGEPDGDAGS